jgi:tRNA 2-thiouridine synthesizing protein A
MNDAPKHAAHGTAETLDLRGLKCPMPALLARRTLAKATAGAVFAVLTDDPMAPIDVPHMAHREGYEVLEIRRDGNNATTILRKP